MFNIDPAQYLAGIDPEGGIKPPPLGVYLWRITGSEDFKGKTETQGKSEKITVVLDDPLHPDLNGFETDFLVTTDPSGLDANKALARKGEFFRHLLSVECSDGQQTWSYTAEQILAGAMGNIDHETFMGQHVYRAYAPWDAEWFDGSAPMPADKAIKMRTDGVVPDVGSIYREKRGPKPGATGNAPTPPKPGTVTPPAVTPTQVRTATVQSQQAPQQAPQQPAQQATTQPPTPPTGNPAAPPPAAAGFAGSRPPLPPRPPGGR